MNIPFNTNLIDTNRENTILVNKREGKIACTCNKIVGNFNDSSDVSHFTVDHNEKSYNSIKDFILSVSKEFKYAVPSSKDAIIMLDGKMLKINKDAYSKARSPRRHARGNAAGGRGILRPGGKEPSNTITIKCKCCGATIDFVAERFFKNISYYSNATLQRPISLTIFDDTDSRGFISLKKITQEMALVNGKVLRSMVHDKVSFNLNTGKSYRIPLKVFGPNLNVRNGSLSKADKKKQRAKEFSLSDLSNNGFCLEHFLYNLHRFVYKKYSQKSSDDFTLNIKNTIMSEIIKYKKDKFNIDFYNKDVLGYNNSDISLFNRYGNFYLDNYDLLNESDGSIMSLKTLSKFRKSIPSNKDVKFSSITPAEIRKKINDKKFRDPAYIYLIPLYDILSVDNANKFTNFKKICNRQYIIEDIYTFIKRYRWKYKKKYNETVLVNSIISIIDKGHSSVNNFKDIMKIFNNHYRKIDFYFTLKDVNNAHDRLSLFDLKNSPDKHINIKYSKSMKNKVNKTCSNIDFRLVTNTVDLAVAGTLMHICVNSYREEVINRELCIVIGWQGEMPVVCIELDNALKCIRQFKFKYNKNLGKRSCNKSVNDIKEDTLNSSLEYLNYIRDFVDISCCSDLNGVKDEILKGSSFKSIAKSLGFNYTILFSDDTYKNILEEANNLEEAAVAIDGELEANVVRAVEPERVARRRPGNNNNL